MSQADFIETLAYQEPFCTEAFVRLGWYAKERLAVRTWSVPAEPGVSQPFRFAVAKCEKYDAILPASVLWAPMAISLLPPFTRNVTRTIKSRDTVSHANVRLRSSKANVWARLKARQ